MRRDDIHEEVSVIKKQMEDCLKRLDRILEMSTELNNEDEEETRPTKPNRWRLTTLGIGKSADFTFTMSFGVKFVKKKNLDKASFFETEFDDAKYRVYFEFHNEDPGGTTCRLESRTDSEGKPSKGRRTEAIKPVKNYNWLTRLRGRKTADRQFLIEENEDKTGTYASFSYYISVKTSQ